MSRSHSFRRHPTIPLPATLAATALAALTACSAPAPDPGCHSDCGATSTCTAGTCVAACTDPAGCDQPTPCVGAGCTTVPPQCVDASDCAAPEPCEVGAGARCVDGVCAYAARVCAAPPADGCFDTATLRRYAAPGACSNGDCTYGYVDIACAHGCAGGQCAACAPTWVDASSCACAAMACSDCAGIKLQTDGCGDGREVPCTVAATCTEQCCGDACCAVDDACVAGGCCRPDCSAGCGDDGCGNSCGTCPSACAACDSGETCADDGCAAIVLLRALEGAAPPTQFACPVGYTEVGHWRTGPGVADGAMEGEDVHGYVVDAGWMWLCSAIPASVRIVASDSDCGAPTPVCDGEMRGRWRVGGSCGGAAAGIDADGVERRAGWLGLCVRSARVGLRIGASFDDCGGAATGCGTWQRRGSWHTSGAGCGGGVAAVGGDGSEIRSGWVGLCLDGEAFERVDGTTLEGKVMAGYQGWFAAPGDGRTHAPNSWRHWFGGAAPDAGNATFDLWPDLSEMSASEKFATNMTLPGGGAAPLFSAARAATVDRHFKWMTDYGIDGVFLQRFVSEISAGAGLEFRDMVTNNVIAAASAHGRTFAIMYDISGGDPATFVSDVIGDWQHLIDDLGLVTPRYQHHAGLPLVAIWGPGFHDRPGTVADAHALLDFFASAANPVYRATVLGGVPSRWRTSGADSQPGYDSVYARYGVLSPWMVGRYSDLQGVVSFHTNQITPDLEVTALRSQDYMPVIFPGFSWANLRNDPTIFNQIPRLGGAFYWKQIYELFRPQNRPAVTMLFIAMFDEVDEGTAIFKAATEPAQLPVQGQFLHLGQDGDVVPNDWYLRLSGAAGKAMAMPETCAPALPMR